MSGDTDKLTDVEAWARDTLSVAAIVRARDVLALVEIARAARDHLEYSNHEAWCVNYTKGGCDCGFAELRAALSALDGDT